MSWKTLTNYDELVEKLPSSDILYSQGILKTFKHIVKEHNLTLDQALEFVSVVITNDKLQNKVLSNKWITKLNELSETNLALDSKKHNIIRYECIHAGPTETVLDYLNKNKPCQNYHKDLCEKCNSNYRKTSITEPSVQPIRESFRAICCIAAKTLGNKGYNFVLINTDKSFLSDPQTNEKCKKLLSPASKFQIIQNVLINKIGYQQLNGNRASFYHPVHGYALVHCGQILIYSKDPSKVEKQISFFFQITSNHNDFLFLGLNVHFYKNRFDIGAEKYITRRIENNLFFEESLDYITARGDYPVDGYFGFLSSPPNDDPESVDDRFIQNETRRGNLWWVSHMPWNDYESYTDSEISSFIGILTHISDTSRWDLKYYVDVLQRYRFQPNKIAYGCIINLFKYIYSTCNFTTVYNRLPTNAPMVVDIYTDGYFLDDHPGSTQSGYLINICGKYWHSESELINLTVEEDVESAIYSAHEAVKYLVTHVSFLQTMEKFCGAKFKYQLHVEDTSLVDIIVNNEECTLYDAYLSRLNALIKWCNKYKIDVFLIESEDNPAGILTYDNNDHRDFIFEESRIANCINEQFDSDGDD